MFVALADNKNQGIVPVAAILGNGEDPQHNLYWGSAYGVKTFFSRSSDWRLIACYLKPRTEVPKPEILERCVSIERRRRDHRLAHAEGEQPGPPKRAAFARVGVGMRSRKRGKGIKDNRAP